MSVLGLGMLVRRCALCGRPADASIAGPNGTRFCTWDHKRLWQRREAEDLARLEDDGGPARPCDAT